MVRLLTGSTGMIGKNLKELLKCELTPTREELDLRNFDDTRKYLKHTTPDEIIHCASNDDEICLHDNLRMFVNLAESKIPMIIFSTGRDVEDRPGKSGEYILSKYISQELALNKYNHIMVMKVWGCFGKYERDIRFLRGSILRVKQGLPISVWEDKYFSYVYVKDLAKVIDTIPITSKALNIVGYTEKLSTYGKILAEITGSEVIVEKECFEKSYVGKKMDFPVTELKTAIKEVWDA